MKTAVLSAGVSSFLISGAIHIFTSGGGIRVYVSNPIPILFVGLERGLKNELPNECVFCIWGGDLGTATTSGFRSFANGFTYDFKNNTCAEVKSHEKCRGGTTSIPHI